MDKYDATIQGTFENFQRKTCQGSRTHLIVICFSNLIEKEDHLKRRRTLISEIKTTVLEFVSDASTVVDHDYFFQCNILAGITSLVPTEKELEEKNLKSYRLTITFGLLVDYFVIRCDTPSRRSKINTLDSG